MNATLNTTHVTAIKGGPKDFFMQLLYIALLYLCVISFIALIFQYINYAFPDELEYDIGNYALLSTVRWTSAALIVGYPVFILLAWATERVFHTEPEKRELRTRKWLLYFTLFAAAITIIIDLITLIYQFLGGELTTRFLLKIVSILSVAGAVFGYYLWDIRRGIADRSQVPKFAAYATGLLVFASIVSGFFLIGTPSEQRSRRFDEERLGHLQLIQQETLNYWIQKNELPEALSKLANDLSGFSVPTDPETAEIYEYTQTSPLSFELCATFKTDTTEDRPKTTAASRPVKPYAGFSDERWEHKAERTCFTRTIDPALYRTLQQLEPKPAPIIR